MSYALALSIAGLTCNGFGVLLLAREVYLAHKTEDFIIFLRQSLNYAKALRADPLGQSQRDLEELEAKIKAGTATSQERLAHALQEAVRGLPLTADQLKAMEDHGKQVADEVTTSLTEKAQAFDARVTPARLKSRRNLLIFGVVLLLLGNFLQGLGAHFGVSPTTEISATSNVRP
ncbi:MAG: hypothetical protein Q7J36_11885 [Thiobacillus sp.]|nr:hypothetical protein [Thiobacillus sp.]